METDGVDTRLRLFGTHCGRRALKALASELPPGVLACLDGYMNIAMEQTEEYVNGQLKAKYGDTFIRGNNGVFCSPSLITLPARIVFATAPARASLADRRSLLAACRRSALH